MCGIAGRIFKSRKYRDPEEEKRMQDTLIHRGPDGQGIAESSKVILGVKRLSIIDVEGENQSLFNKDKSIDVVGNGEIYNYIELASKLKSLDHKLKTSSDIETAVHTLEQWDMLKDL